MSLDSIGGFHMPDWIQHLTGGAGATGVGMAGDTTGEAPGVAAAKRCLLPSLDEVKSRLMDDWNRLKPDSLGKIGWLQGKGAPTRDVTARFRQLNASAGAGKSTLPPDAKNYVYLMVPGLFTERYPGYMNDNVAKLRSDGLDVRKVPVDTDASVDANAKVVRDAILEASKSGKQVVLIGHSKGGVDATAALSLYPELRPHVRALVAMQTPYAGSPIASDVQTCPEMRPHADCFIKSAFRGDPASLKDLSYDSRMKFLAAHPYPPGIPTVSLATSSSSQVSIVAAASNYIRARYGEKADGLVVAKDAEIPGSSVVRLDDLDHAGAAMRGPGCACKYRPGDLTEALVTIALTTPAQA